MEILSKSISSTATILYIYAFVLVSPITHCDNPYECMNQALNDDIIYLEAYKSAVGGDTSMTGQGYCHGSFSCKSMQYIHSGDTSLYCYGTHSCSNTTIVSNTSFIYCHASESCMFSDITSTFNSILRCDGYFSCAYSIIYSMETLRARGSYSLYKAIIDTASITNKTDITLSGDYAGYGATIICRKEYQCNIYCDGFTSCYMLFIDCIGDCIIYNQSQQTILPITNITDFKMLLNHSIFQFETIGLSNDEDCNTESTSITFDSYPSRYNGGDIIITDDKGLICCRSLYSCFNITRILYQSTTKGDIICSGYFACRSSTITGNNGSVFCEGYFSCDKSHIFNTSFIYCMASHSCSYSILTTSRRILCGGFYSCVDVKIMSEGSDLNVYFGGSYSGQNAQIYCNATDLCDIVCAGYKSCFGTILICDGNCTVQCNTESECPLGWNASSTIDLITTPYQTQYEYIANITYNPSIAFSGTVLTESDVDIINNNQSKKFDITLFIVLIVSSLSLLIAIGAVVWYWTKRIKKKQIFENSEGKMKGNVQKQVESIGDMYGNNQRSDDKTAGDGTRTVMGKDDGIEDVIEDVEGDGEQKANIQIQQKRQSLLDEVEGNVDDNKYGSTTLNDKVDNVKTRGFSIDKNDIYYHGAADT